MQEHMSVPMSAWMSEWTTVHVPNEMPLQQSNFTSQNYVCVCVCVCLCQQDYLLHSCFTTCHIFICVYECTHALFNRAGWRSFKGGDHFAAFALQTKQQVLCFNAGARRLSNCFGSIHRSQQWMSHFTVSLALVLQELLVFLAGKSQRINRLPSQTFPRDAPCLSVFPPAASEKDGNWKEIC